MFNSRSLTHKVEYLLELVAERQPDLILITETWLTSNYADSEFTLPNYNMVRCDRPENRRGGGLMVYISVAYQFTTEAEPVILPTESTWCKVEHTEQTFARMHLSTTNKSIKSNYTRFGRITGCYAG